MTCAIAECEEKRIKIINKRFFLIHVGIFYHGMTQFLGYKNYGEEYKMMGLAPYGKPKYSQKNNSKSFQNLNANKIELNLEYFNHWKHDYKYITGDSLEIDQIF